MSLEILAKHYRLKYEQYEKVILPEPEPTKQEQIFKNPFLTADDIFSDIVPAIETDKFYALSLVGPQGKGKTVLSQIFATKAKGAGFTIVYAKAEDIVNDIDGWVAEVRSLYYDKLCLVLDDFSYSIDTISKKKQAAFKHFVAQIRHIFDTKMFMIYISHRLHSLPPMLRNSGSWIFASMQAADREDAQKLIARRKEMRDRLDAIYSFIGAASIKGPKLGTINYRVGDHEVVFRWGKDGEPGDGRLMVVYHSGDIKIFNSKMLPEMIDLESCRINIPTLDEPVILPEEQIQLEEKTKEEFKAQALQLFPVKDDDEKAIMVVKKQE